VGIDPALPADPWRRRRLGGSAHRPRAGQDPRPGVDVSRSRLSRRSDACSRRRGAMVTSPPARAARARAAIHGCRRGARLAARVVADRALGESGHHLGRRRRILPRAAAAGRRADHGQVAAAPALLGALNAALGVSMNAQVVVVEGHGHHTLGECRAERLDARPRRASVNPGRDNCRARRARLRQRRRQRARNPSR